MASKFTVNTFTMFCRGLKTMSPSLAVMVGYLTAMQRLKCKSNKYDWFPCPTEAVESDIGMDMYQQSRLIRKLRDLNFVKVKRAGRPAIRWVRFVKRP